MEIKLNDWGFSLRGKAFSHNTASQGDFMKTRIFTLFSLLFLTPFILLSCKATVEAGSEQIESEVFDDFS